MAGNKSPRSSRIEKLRAQVLGVPEICLERGQIMTASYRETEGEPPVLRRAKALKKILSEMTICIADGELIVGRTTSKARGGALLPEVAWEWYLDELDSLSTREWNRYAPLKAAEKSSMKEFLPYWKGQSLFDKFCGIIPPEALKLHHVIEEAGGHAVNNIHQGHTSVDYEVVLTLGLKGINDRVNAEIEKLDLACIEDFEKYQFLSAVKITIEGALIFAKRYAELAGQMARREKNAKRKAELEIIAATCARVPENPARDFYEALQSMWLTYCVIMIEGFSYGIGFGRPDQFLYPYFKKDIAEGKLTEERAIELISLFYIKINSSVVPICLAAARTYGGHPLTANVTVGGLTRDGRDAVNDLSYLFLEAEKNLGLSGEDIIVRIHHNTPDKFVLKACEVAKSLRGKIKFVSDETAVQQLLTDGKPGERARDYIIDGCLHPSVAGFSADIPGGLLNLPLLLELALNNGKSRLSGQQIGPRTGDPRKFKSYQEVWDAYTTQVRALIPVLMLIRNTDDVLYAQFAPTPFQSGLFEGCIESGRDLTAGGTYPFIAHAISLSGAPNVGDSFAAIKKAVFEDKKITMSELIDALDDNFRGHQKVLHAVSKCPKFGNDDDYVDSIVNDVLVHGAREASRYPGIAGARTTVAAHVVTGDIPMGQIVGALPDGRKAGEPLSEGGLSPAQGRNTAGPVATMRSIAKLDHLKITNGSVLNMRFNPDAVKDETRLKRFAAMLRTFCETGGFLVQFNFVDTQTLKAAQLHPDNYRDLLVRVATYSAYFVELSPELQNDIIARMEFEEV